MVEPSESKAPGTVYIHRFLAVFLDVIIAVLFVVIGKKEHDASYAFGDYVRVVLPFLASFFAVQLVLGKDQRDVKWGFIAAVISVPIAIALRVAQPQHDFKIAFFIVSWIFLTAGWTLWRFILGKLRPAQN